ncbi:hypothetical protein BGP_0637 [Beggiatoa sp. PS]|nr:hypothetical protein BGP_0637 [Beggiatoa sp. PS]
MPVPSPSEEGLGRGPVGEGLGRGPVGGGLGRGPIEKGPFWIYSDPSGQQHCMVKETQWVANYLNTQSGENVSIFEALQNLAKSQHVHLATHGAFRRDDPIASHLSLDDNQKLYFPLWISAAVRIPADLLVLSACESNLNGRDTKDLLTPIGIGPALAAAGAKTVVGTLWEMSGAACFFFNYHFYQLMDEKPNCPWHQLVTEARKKLQTMSFETAKAILVEIGWDDKEQPCRDDIDSYITIAENTHSPPFEDFWLWAGFSVLGQVQREK